MEKQTLPYFRITQDITKTRMSSPFMSANSANMLAYQWNLCSIPRGPSANLNRDPVHYRCTINPAQPLHA